MLSRDRMTDAEYERERAKLRELYGDSSVEAAAKRDQTLAILFYQSHWTQDELAEKEGKSQSYLAKMLRFGRFLNFSPTGLNPEKLPNNLTERRFRDYWERTDKSDGNERIRFKQVLDLINNDIRIGKNSAPKGYSKIIRENFANGKWYPLSEMTEVLEATEKELRQTLQDMEKRGQVSVDHRLKGRDQHVEYRLFKKDRTVGATELTEKLGPIIEGLKIEGKKNMATMVPAVVATLAERLQRLLDEWTK